MRSIFRPLSVVVIGLLAIAGQAQAPPLEFEFTSVKVHAIPPNTYLIKNFTHAPPFVVPTSNTFKDTVHAQDLIMEAYGLNEYQILYLPGWALSQRGLVYDVDAKAKGDGIPTPPQMQQMLQGLLADRFHLKVHWETKPKFSLYALVVDKKEPKFKELAEPSAQVPGTTLFALARFLTPNLDFPVIDGTGLPAHAYDFDIDKLVDFHEIDREQGVNPLEAMDYLRSVVQHELGLRLDSRKVSMQVLVIDHIDEPETK